MYNSKITFAEKLESIGYIFLASELSIEPIKYNAYLREYGSDNTTSPHGIANRIHIRENEENETFEIWSWGAGGNHLFYTRQSFDKLEEAEQFIYECMEEYIENHNWDAPIFCDTEEEAMCEMAESLDRNIEVVRRYIAISRLAARKEADRKKEAAKKYAEEKAALANAVENESKLIVIDDLFVADIKASRLLTGMEKNNAQSAALVALLSRLNYGKIKSDFWQVFKKITQF